MLFILVILAYDFICLYICRVGPDARRVLTSVIGRGPFHVIDKSVLSRARYRAGSDGCWA